MHMRQAWCNWSTCHLSLTGLSVRADNVCVRVRVLVFVCLCWYVCVCVCVSSRACCSTVCIVGVQGHITPLTSSFDKSQLFGSLVAESPDFVKHEL